MTRLLAYNSPTPGHVLPAAGILLELHKRGHEVHVRTQASEVERFRRLGLHAEAVDPAIEAIELEDWSARTQIEAQKRLLNFYLARARLEVPDLRRAVDELQPDMLVIDVQTEGAAYVAEASQLPWAMYCPYPPAFRSTDAPPFGLGLAPAKTSLGRVRDRLVHAYAARVLAPHVAARNVMREALGLAPLQRYEDQWHKPQRFLALTAEPYEFHRSDWPANVRLVGPIPWEPDAEQPAWLLEEKRPIILVTASTAYQHDEKLISTALQAFAGEDVALIVTTAATDPRAFRAPPNARVEQFMPHAPIIERAACVVCHGGQGTTQKALAAGIPVCAVPFCRDQFDVARRVEYASAGTKLHHKRLNRVRLRRAVQDAIARRTGAERVARAFAQAGGASAAADAIDELPINSRNEPAGRSSRQGSAQSLDARSAV
jgi:MGT family glycosyltransferase